MLSLQRQRLISGSLIGRPSSRKNEVLVPYFAGRDDLQAMLRVCDALRDHVKGLLMANLKSGRHGSP